MTIFQNITHALEFQRNLVFFSGHESRMKLLCLEEVDILMFFPEIQDNWCFYQFGILSRYYDSEPYTTCVYHSCSHLLNGIVSTHTFFVFLFFFKKKSQIPNVFLAFFCERVCAQQQKETEREQERKQENNTN